MQSPFLSIVVPTRQAADVLERSLGALGTSDLPRECWELIVVDDASTDDSAALAAAYADVVVRLPGESRGTAYALNRGFEVARGEFVAFLSAGVRVQPDTLRRLVSALAAESDVVAVCGTIDCDGDTPADLVTSYDGLYEAFVRAESAGETEALWAACSVVRASAFAQAGMFDEWCVGRPRTAAAEMGRRLRAGGGRILLRSDVRVCPVVPQTVGRLLAEALRDDGVPSSPLEAPVPGAGRDARIHRAESWSASLTAAMLALAALAIVARLPLSWVGVAALAGAVDVINGSFYAYVGRLRGARQALLMAPLHTLRVFCVGAALVGGWLYRHVLGERRPRPTIQAWAEVGITTWPPVPARRRSASVVTAAAVAGIGPR